MFTVQHWTHNVGSSVVDAVAPNEAIELVVGHCDQSAGAPGIWF